MTRRDLVGVALVEEHDRVQVAVAGMKDIGDAQLVPSADLGDGAQDLREFGAGDDAVLGDARRGEAAQGADGLLAGGPQVRPVARRLRLADLAGVVAFAQGADAARPGCPARRRGRPVR